MAQQPNSLGEIESPDQLAPTPNTGGEIPDPPQTPEPDVDDTDQWTETAQ